MVLPMFKIKVEGRGGRVHEGVVSNFNLGQIPVPVELVVDKRENKLF